MQRLWLARSVSLLPYRGGTPSSNFLAFFLTVLAIENRQPSFPIDL